MSERQRRYSARSARKVPADQEQERRALLEDALVRSSNFAPAVVAVFDQINPIKMPPSFRIKYTRFRGDGSQDVDDWMEQYLATLAANDEGDEDTTKRLFRGLIDGEALRWYNALDAGVRADWARLKSAFEQEFREVGADSRVMARLNAIKMKPADTLRSYTQRVQQLVGKLSTAPPANLQLEWFISGLPELLDFEVRKADPQTFAAAVDIAKKYEKSALLSGRWAEKKQKKKVRFEESDDSDDYLVEDQEGKPNHHRAKESQQSQLTKIVKDEMQTLRAAIEEVKVQMADIKKARKPVPMARTNIWCTRCKKEGHFSHDCHVDWRMIQEEELSSQESEFKELESLYAIQQGAMRAEMRARPGAVPRIPGTCWDCGEVGHISPECPYQRKSGEYILLCGNCREEGHKASKCTKPLQPRMMTRFVPTPPRDQTALNWSNKAAAEQPDEAIVSNVRWIQNLEEENVWKVSTRRQTYEEKGKRPTALEVRSEGEEEEEAPAFELPDVTEEVLAHLEELHAKEGETSTKTTMVVRPSLSPAARRELHYNIMQDIEKRLAEVTIGQLLRDNPKYRKQVMDAIKIRRRKRLPPTISEVRYTEVEDWGAPEIDTEIEGCLILRVPVDGGSGVNVMMEQTAADLGYTTFEPTPKILRMANQEEVVPVGKLSQVVTRMGELEYKLNFVVIRLPIPATFQVLLGRPWLYKAGVLEDWKKKEFRIGSVRIPWGLPTHQGETSDGSLGYTTESDETSEEEQVSDCWMVVNALKTATEEEFGFNQPEEEHVQVQEDSDEEEPTPLLLEDQQEEVRKTKKKNEHALGELDVPFTAEWVHQQLNEDPGMEGYHQTFGREKEESLSPAVKPVQYEKMCLTPEMEFYLGRTIQEVERNTYKDLLLEFKGVFAWSHHDLTGIAPQYGEHRIDLKEEAVPIRQRQYRLNPKYSLKVKEELDKLLEAGFIYPVKHSEWVSPIVIVPKKVGAGGVKSFFHQGWLLALYYPTTDVLEAGRLASYEWMWGMLGGHRLASPMSGDGARLSSCSWQGRHAWEVAH
ncbi:unnamed protein product [Calypogeia fissa]